MFVNKDFCYHNYDLMTQDEGNPTSFYNAEPKDFGCVLKVDQVDAIFKSQYPENWSVAWAPDCSFVAWSQGAGIVYLLPWERHAGQILKKPTRNRSFENIAELVDEEAFINNLPRLVSDNSILDDDTERVKFCHQNDQQAAQCYRIDCMDIVWSMAFGGSHTEGSNIWRSYNSRCDLILATGLQGGKIKLWNVYCGNLLMELLDHKSIVRGLSFTCDGSFRLVSCSNDCTVKFWDLEDDGNMYKTVRFCEKTMVWGCKWSPNNKHVAAVGMQKKVYLWNADDLRKPALKLFGHHHSVASCDFSPDGALLATASFDTHFVEIDPYIASQNLDVTTRNMLSIANLLDLGFSVERCSRDTHAPNNYGYRLIDLCKSANIYIANGRLGKDIDIGQCTCISSTLIDYVLLSLELFPRTVHFEVQEHDPSFSDVHSCVEFNVYLRLYILLYADDTVILAESHADLQAALNAMLEYCNIHLFPPPRLIYAGGANDHYVRDLSFSRDGQHIATVSDDGTRVDGTLQIYRPPNMGVTSLQHLCRLKIRHKLESKAIDHLPLPCRIKEFLKDEIGLMPATVSKYIKVLKHLRGVAKKDEAYTHSVGNALNRSSALDTTLNEQSKADVN
ncbi:WSB1-like protein [Mya arenaria]|uniref:WSB1-like protein n=1 Tax=Mya arenaria TaxID=6604 RepID=A0ABY7E3X2_MYAAR|nr:WSB1-like protein [Mya arenaria]